MTILSDRIEVDSRDFYEEDILIRDFLGIHQRPSRAIAILAGKYEGDVRISYGSCEADAKSEMEVMLLSVIGGETVRLKVSKKYENYFSVANNIISLMSSELMTPISTILVSTN